MRAYISLHVTRDKLIFILVGQVNVFTPTKSVINLDGSHIISLNLNQDIYKINPLTFLIRKKTRVVIS